MNTLSLPGACLCLATGALLGGAFLALKLARLLLRGGRILLFVSDLLLGPLCAVVAFTVALAIDKGRLRLFQVVLQGLGAWGTICALDSLVNGTAAWLRKVTGKLRGFLRRRIFRPLAVWGKRLFARVKELLRKLLPAKKPKKRRRARRGKGRGKQAAARTRNHLPSNGRTSLGRSVETRAK